MEEKLRKINNPDVPDSIIMKYQWKEIEKKDKRIRELEKELEIKNKCIADFKKWQIQALNHNYQYLFNEGLKLVENPPQVQIDAAKKFVELFRNNESFKRYCKRMAKRLNSFLISIEICKKLKAEE